LAVLLVNCWICCKEIEKGHTYSLVDETCVLASNIHHWSDIHHDESIALWKTLKQKTDQNHIWAAVEQ